MYLLRENGQDPIPAQAIAYEDGSVLVRPLDPREAVDGYKPNVWVPVGPESAELIRELLHDQELDE